MSVLETIDGPQDLRALTAEQVELLVKEIREFLVEHVCRTGGHLGANLSVVELTVAVHRVLSSPRDVVVWDTGHQAYVHKMLTGRAGEFGSLRTAGGLSGYPSRSESSHDHVENSHASTALSYADGISRAFALRGERDRVTAAVVGDGALTGGMCWEALNNIGADRSRRLVVVLNDNGRSYGPTAGVVADHLAELRRGSGGALFTSLGFDYIGPVDGHDTAAVERAMLDAVRHERPVVVHCVTEKGKGYRPAEADESDRMHAVGPLNPLTGTPLKAPASSWTDVFADEMREVARRRPDVVGITAAMLEPVGFGPLRDLDPSRVLDVGIAEQHATTMAAGLAMNGWHPVVAVYSTFLNRAYDQVLMDVALHRLPVTFVLDRAGVTGPDGPSHHGIWDFGLLASVPGMRVAAPRDADRVRELLREAVEDGRGPTALRYPKSAVTASVPAIRRIGLSDVLADGRTVLIISVGAVAERCLEAAARLERSGVSAMVIDPRWVLPVATELIELAANRAAVVVVEDGVHGNGVGAAIGTALQDNGVFVAFRSFGLRHGFVPQGSRAGLLDTHGLEVDEMVEGTLRMLG